MTTVNLYDLQTLPNEHDDMAVQQDGSFSSILICNDSTITCGWCH